MRNSRRTVESVSFAATIRDSPVQRLSPRGSWTWVGWAISFSGRQGAQGRSGVRRKHSLETDPCQPTRIQNLRPNRKIQANEEFLAALRHQGRRFSPFPSTRTPEESPRDCHQLQSHGSRGACAAAEADTRTLWGMPYVASTSQAPDRQGFSRIETVSPPQYGGTALRTVAIYFSQTPAA